ncbi:hypothetical protein PRIPAC_74407 [Pristionchus pacificus]|uniref:Arf-GAP domain-containing protein n=1 Tax=Pristionchus pacificus TaxID=54126 RepID=A0A2A6D088_PRIPA|nr:hypothetical protein PRIPAC_74407 [Pristionchus pacificus]|eukprot:PDM83788.1 hypothetical protein PRIPAC_30275 [Pristionchus pacificus]
MSQTIPISSTSKKRLDEKNGKIVKDLSLQLENRNCVECGMRGPTYVDVTTTSYCCASCAGVLRGINPPHRIKSISMATFSCDEVETLKNGGNELNRRTWMGLHSGPQLTNFASKDDRTNFITEKYERKKWYVSPEEVAKQKELLDRAIEAKSEQLNMTNTRNESMDLFSSVSLGGNQSARPPPSVSLDSVFAPPSLLTGVSLDRVIPLDEPHPFSPPAFMAPPPPQPGSHPTSLPINQQPTHMPINFSFGSPPSGLVPQCHHPSAVSPPSSMITPIDPFSPLTTMPKQFPKDSSRLSQVPPSSSFTPSSSSMDPFGGDPFAPSSNNGGGDPFGASSFSGFAVKFDDDTPTSSGPSGGQLVKEGHGIPNPFDPFGMIAPNLGVASQPSPQPSSVLPPSSSSSSSLDPFSSLVSLPSAAAFPSQSVAPPVPTVTPAVAKTASPSIPPVVSNNDGDKYSALAELDELFHSTTISGDASNGKPSWVSTGFSAPPPTSGAAFPPSTGMAKSSTMGAISSIPSSTSFGGGTSTTSTSFWAVNTGGGSHAPFTAPPHGFPQSTPSAPTGMGGVSHPGVYPQLNTAVPQQSQYAQAAAMTGNPFAAFPQTALSQQPMASNGQPSNPNWNPFL